MTNMRVGFVGLGAMGMSMAGHLAAAGYLTVVWNRTEEKSQVFSQQWGVPVAASLQGLAASADVIFICVSADQDLEAVVSELLVEPRSGQIIVDTSTVSPASARRLAQQLSEHGIQFVDAPVSGGVEGAKNGQLSVMAGGRTQALDAVRPLIMSFAKSLTHMGPAGSGQATKAVNQVLVAGIAEAVCEGLAMADKLSLPEQRLIEVLTAGAADNWFLRHRGQSMLAEQFGVGFKQSLLLKDLLICDSLARDMHINLPGVRQAIEDYRRLVAAGEGENDISGLFRLKSGKLNTD